MVDKTGLWLPRLGVLQIENLSTAGNFKLKGNLILWNKTSKRQKILLFLGGIRSVKFHILEIGNYLRTVLDACDTET